MGSPLGCLFGFFMAILAFLLLAVIGIARKVRSIISQFTSQGNTKRTSRPGQEDTRKKPSSASSPPRSHKKVFEDNEGEYVDFEEIK